MFINKDRYRGLYRAIAIGVVCLFLVNDAAFASAFEEAALAPPLATKPTCEIIRKTDGSYDVVSNKDVIKSFRNRWAFVDVSYLIGQMLILTREHKLQNPKEILIPLIKKHIRNRDSMAEILLEGFEIDNIEELREGQVIIGFALPVTRHGFPAYQLVYNLRSGDTSIQMQDGKSVYVKVENITHAQEVETDEDDSHYRRADIISGGKYADSVIARFGEYRGEVYYPYAGYDAVSLRALINMFPKASRFVLNDSFNQKETSIAIPGPEDIDGIAADLQKFFEPLKYGLGNFHIEIVDSKTLRIMIKIENDKTKTLLKRDSIEILYKIGEHEEESGKYGIIYIQVPGMGGRLSESDDFYIRVLSRLEDKGALLVSRANTSQPNISGLTYIATVMANIAFDFWSPFIKPWEIYEKAPAPVQSGKIAKALSPESERIHATNFQDSLTYIQTQSQTQPLRRQLGADSHLPSFTPLEKAADFSRRLLPHKANGGSKPPLALTIREHDSSLTGFTEETIEALEVSGGNRAKAGGIFGITRQAVWERIQAIRKAATETGDTATLERLDKALISPLPSFTEKTLKALEVSGGNRTKAAGILGITMQAVFKREGAIRKAAVERSDTATLKRLEKVLPSLPSYTEETLKVWEETRGNQTKTGRIIGITQPSVVYRIKHIRKVAVERGDIAILERLSAIHLPVAISPESERTHAINLQDILSYIQSSKTSITNNEQRKTNDELRPLIIALGTNWIKGYERDEDGRSFRYLQGKELNELIVSIRAYCDSKGIPFIADNDDKLPARINAEKAKEGKTDAKVVVLAGKDVVISDEFTALRNDEKNAFVIGVDNQKLTIDSYIRLMEMLAIALKLSAGLEISQDATPIKIVKDDKLHIYIFIPPAQPMDYEQQKAIYEVQKFA